MKILDDLSGQEVESTVEFVIMRHFDGKYVTFSGLDFFIIIFVFILFYMYLKIF